MSEIDFDGETDTVWESYLLDRLLDPEGTNDGATTAPHAAALYLFNDDEEQAVLAGALGIRDADTYEDATDFFTTDADALFDLVDGEETGTFVDFGGTKYRVAEHGEADGGQAGPLPVTHLHGEGDGIVLVGVPGIVVACSWDEDRKNTPDAATAAAVACARALRADLAL
ncbi:hypothetical protein [Streptomyces sp. SID3212]|uniref:hypothetical protein n=1 Tax=unclassified Streptomyces TaxID=2593676 RepID=UPI00136DD664|nr:hypothetical protein [Streptomyces sp. SID3212]MYV55438.1 hypothetical protein [Streptomyces sp. SID3212]